MGSVNHLFYSRMVRFYKKIQQHVAEYCEQAAIHGPQHIVSERLTRYERLVINSNEKCLLFLYEYSITVVTLNQVVTCYCPQNFEVSK